MSPVRPGGDPGLPPAAGGGAPPIFIVGTSRSGTSLLASLLGAHPAVACGPETALFLHLEGHARAILDDPAWPERAVGFLTDLRRETANETVLAHYRLTPERVRRALESQEPSARALMESLTVSYQRDQGKRRWAEKTPKHLWHVAAIRRLWPDAPVIRIVRDPRGVALSTRTWPFTRGAVRVAYTWLLDDEHWRSFAAGDGRALEVRYEDLLADPEATLRRVCDFVGEAFDPRMLHAGGARANVVPDGEPWHHLVAGPVEPARATAWQRDLPESDQVAVALVCGRAMVRHGYPAPAPPRAVAAIHPWIRSLVRAEPVLDVLAAAGVAGVDADAPAHGPAARARGTGDARSTGGARGTGGALHDESARSTADAPDATGAPRTTAAATEGPFPPSWTIVVGLPGETRLSRSAGSGLGSLARWAVRLAGGRLRGRPVLWAPVPLGRPGRSRLLDRAGDLLLRALARRVSPDRIRREVGG